MYIHQPNNEHYTTVKYLRAFTDSDSVPGSAPNTDSARVFHVEAHCYDPQKELNCAVCTK